VPAWVFLPYWIGLQPLSIAMGSQDSVAYAVHAGSFTAGAIGAIIWKTSYMGPTRSWPRSSRNRSG